MYRDGFFGASSIGGGAGGGGNVDLTPFAKIMDVNALVAQTESLLRTDIATVRSEIPVVPPPPDLTPFALRSEIPPSADLSVYVLKTEIPVVPPAPDLSPFALRTEIPVVPPPPDLSPFALTSVMNANFATKNELQTVSAGASGTTVSPGGFVEAGIWISFAARADAIGNPLSMNNCTFLFQPAQSNNQVYLSDAKSAQGQAEANLRMSFVNQSPNFSLQVIPTSWPKPPAGVFLQYTLNASTSPVFIPPLGQLSLYNEPGNPNAFFGTVLGNHVLIPSIPNANFNQGYENHFDTKAANVDFETVTTPIPGWIRSGPSNGRDLQVVRCRYTAGGVFINIDPGTTQHVCIRMGNASSQYILSGLTLANPLRVTPGARYQFHVWALRVNAYPLMTLGVLDNMNTTPFIRKNFYFSILVSGTGAGNEWRWHAVDFTAPPSGLIRLEISYPGNYAGTALNNTFVLGYCLLTSAF
jgi:hypothetical protein